MKKPNIQTNFKYIISMDEVLRLIYSEFPNMENEKTRVVSMPCTMLVNPKTSKKLRKRYKKERRLNNEKGARNHHRDGV